MDGGATGAPQIFVPESCSASTIEGNGDGVLEALLSPKAGCQGFVLDSLSDICMFENEVVGGGGGGWVGSEGIGGAFPIGFLLKGFVSVRASPGIRAFGTSSCLAFGSTEVPSGFLLPACHGFSSLWAKLEEDGAGANPGRKVSGISDNESDLSGLVGCFISVCVSSVCSCVRSCVSSRVCSCVPHIRSASSGSESVDDHNSCRTPIKFMWGELVRLGTPSSAITLRVTIVVWWWDNDQGRLSESTNDARDGYQWWGVNEDVGTFRRFGLEDQ